MQVLKSQRAGFLYETVRGKLRPRIAGTSVLVSRWDPNAELLLAADALDIKRFAKCARQKARLGEGYLELTSTTLATEQRMALAGQLGAAGLAEQRFERDDCLFAACTQVSFHHDLPLAGIFGAWCLTGPARDLIFPHVGLRVPFSPGTFVIFDSVQPHGLLAAGETKFKANARCDEDLTIFVSVLLNDNDPGTNAQLGRERIDVLEHQHLPRLEQGQAADPVSGALQFSTIQRSPS
jgi:hypothetical protein